MTAPSSGSSLINTGALIRATGVGVAVAFVLEMISFGIGLASASAVAGVSSSETSTLLTALSAVAICSCCVILLFFGGVGAAYSWFAERSGSPMDAGPMAVGGALAAFISGLLLGLCASGVGFVSAPLRLAATSGGSVAPALAGGLAGAAAGGVLGLALNVCVYPLIYAALGAAGAAIYAAVVSNRSKPQPAAM